jgi:hypothetical protein
VHRAPRSERPLIQHVRGREAPPLEELFHYLTGEGMRLDAAGKRLFNG